MGNFKPRAPRVKILPLHNIGFRPKGPLLTPLFPVANVSPNGIGLLAESFKHHPKPGDLIEGSLVIGRESHAGVIKVVHVTSKIIGGSFENPSSSLSAAILNYFQLEIAAIALRKINPKFHKSEPDGASAWFHGDNCELYYVHEGDRVLRFQMAFFGNHVDGNEKGAVSTGQIVEDEPGSGGPKHKGASIIREDLTTSKALLEAAHRFLVNIEDLPDAHYQAINTMLTRA